MTQETREHEVYELARGEDAVLECRVFSHETVKLTADALEAATALTVAPLEWALSNGDKLLFGLNTVVTLTAGAAAGAVALTVSALAGPLRAGDVGQKLRDLTGYTIQYELLAKRGDATPVFAKSGAAITIPSQAGDSRGIVQVAVAAADTLSIPAAGSYFDAYWRTDSGSKKPLSYGPVKAVDAGFLS